MNAITNAQDLQLQLLELARFNNLDGPRVASDLRSNLDLWRSAMLVRLTEPVFQKLENPVTRTTPPVPLVNRVDLICLRDLPDNFINLDTLFIMTEPGMASRLELTAGTWCPDALQWFTVQEARRALGASRFDFTDYGPSDPFLLRLWWD